MQDFGSTGPGDAANRYAADSDNEFKEWLADVKSPGGDAFIELDSQPPRPDTRIHFPEDRAATIPTPAERPRHAPLAEQTSPLSTIDSASVGAQPLSTKLEQLRGIKSRLPLNVPAPPQNGSISVNSAEHRLDTAYLHLRTMDLPREASWSEIMVRYREIITTLNASQPASDSAVQNIEKRRRNVNTAYACLRLLSGRATS